MKIEQINSNNNLENIKNMLENNESLKHDYNFIKYVVLKYKNNIEFIMKIGNEFIESEENELIWRIELSIILEKILPENFNEEYKLINKTKYKGTRVLIELEKLRDKNLEKKAEMGFIYFDMLYRESKEILDYYASKMIEEIFEEINLSKLIHKQCRTPEKIDEIGIYNFIFSIINNYDHNLSNYISVYPNAIKGIVERIRYIQNNWNKYEENEEIERYSEMFNMIGEYFYESKTTLDETQIIYFIAKELGVQDKVYKYDPINNLYDYSVEHENLNNDELSIKEKIEQDIIKEEINSTLENIKAYRDIKKIMISKIFYNDERNLEEILESEEKCKIIKIDTKK